MTRKSEREVARALEDMAGDDADERTVRAWLGEVLAEGWSMSFGTAGEPTDRGEVVVARMPDADITVPEEELPSWVDRDTLPVEA